MIIEAKLYYEGKELELPILKDSPLKIVKEVEREFGVYYCDSLTLHCSNIDGALTTAFSGEGPWEVKLWRDGVLKYGGYVYGDSIEFRDNDYTVRFTVFGYLSTLKNYNAEQCKDEEGNWYKNILVRDLVTKLLDIAKFTDRVVEVPEELPSEDPTFSYISALGTGTAPKSLSITGRNEAPNDPYLLDAPLISLVADKGTFRGTFEKGFNLCFPMGESTRQADWYGQLESFPNYILRDYPAWGDETFGCWPVYDYTQSPKKRYYLHFGMNEGLYVDNWDNSEQQWEHGPLLDGDFTPEKWDGIAINPGQGYIYCLATNIGEPEGPTRAKIRFYNISTETGSTTTTTVHGKTKAGPLGLVNNRCVADKYFHEEENQKTVYFFIGVTYFGKSKVPLGLDNSSLIQDTEHIYGIVSDKESNATYLFISDHNFANQSWEGFKICDGTFEGQYTNRGKYQLTIYNGALYGFVGPNYFRYSREHALIVREANFENMTVSEALRHLAHMSNCVLSVDHNRKAYFVKRDYYKNTQVPNIDPYVIERSVTRKWQNVFDYVKLTYQQGEVVYPEETFGGRCLSVDCPFVYYESYAHALAKALYSFFAVSRRELSAKLTDEVTVPSLSSSSSSFSSSSSLLSSSSSQSSSSQSQSVSSSSSSS